MVEHSKAKIGPILLVIIGVALISIALGYLIFKPDQQQRSEVSLQNQSQVRVPYSNIPRINPDEAHPAYQAGSALFLDVRGSEYYDQAHITGALSIPEEDLPNRLAELPKSQWIITYCT